LSDPVLLARLALDERDDALRCAATTRLRDPTTLRNVSRRYRSSTVGQVAELVLLLRAAQQQGATGDLELRCAVRQLRQHYRSTHGSQVLTLVGEHVEIKLMKGGSVLKESWWASRFPDRTGASGARIPKAVVDVSPVADSLLRATLANAPGVVQLALESPSPQIRRAGVVSLRGTPKADSDDGGPR
jgi:hypothetical protein